MRRVFAAASSSSGGETGRMNHTTQQFFRNENERRVWRSGNASTSSSESSFSGSRREYYAFGGSGRSGSDVKAINHPESKSSSSTSWSNGYAANADFIEDDEENEVQKLKEKQARKIQNTPPPPAAAAAAAAKKQTQYKNDFTFTGEIHRVTFHAEDTGYTVARVLCSDKDTLKELPKGALTKPNRRPKKGQKEALATITVVGEMPNVGVGQTLKLTGYWRSNPKFGVEFVSTKPAEMCVPSDEQGVIAYLSSGILPGCGPVTAEKIVSHFGGKETLAALDSTEGAKLLTKVPGIGAKTAVKLKNNWDESSSKRKATSFLTEELGASALIARRASLKHGAQTEVRVKADPFKALSDIKGLSLIHI